MQIHIIIPSRYASSRFPGKPLADIHGKAMILRVAERCNMARTCSSVTIATDDTRILDLVSEAGYKAIMTAEHHQNGTERLAEAAELLNLDKQSCIINVQGDEPYIHPEQIDQVASLMIDGALISSLVHSIADENEYLNPNVVKAVFDNSQRALYFSRSPLPFLRDESFTRAAERSIFWKHIGIYGYRTGILRELCNLPPSALELAESLEQLRWLQAGYPIQLGITPFASYPVDHPQDINKLPENGRF